MGLVAQVFTEDILRQLTGHIACGHNRYSTTGGSRSRTPARLRRRPRPGAHLRRPQREPGQLRSLRQSLTAQGVTFRTTTDSEVLAALIASAPGRTWEQKIAASLPRCIGSYSLVLMTKDTIFGARDPMGNRPLCLGSREGGGCWPPSPVPWTRWGRRWSGDRPGQLVAIDAHGVRSQRLAASSRRQALCIFEYIYLARTDSVISGQLVNETRIRMGRQLALEHPVEADLVIAVPLSAIAAGHGYAEQAGLPYRDGLASNRYIHRTFIQPDEHAQDLRPAEVQPLPDVLNGKRVVVVDDSIVRHLPGADRGPPARAGAREAPAHLRPSPEAPLLPGSGHGHLRGADRAPPAGRGGDQGAGGGGLLGYLSLEGVYRAVRLDPQGFCTACFSGDYPVPVQLNLERANPKLRLEAERGLQVDIPSATEPPARDPAPPSRSAHPAARKRASLPPGGVSVAAGEAAHPLLTPGVAPPGRPPASRAAPVASPLPPGGGYSFLPRRAGAPRPLHPQQRGP